MTKNDCQTKTPGEDGNIKRIIQFGPNAQEILTKFNGYYVPKWAIVMIGLGLTEIAIVFSAGIYVFIGSKLPGVYNESCLGRSCTKGLNLKCINGQCLCEMDNYYVIGCQARKQYLKPCYGDSSCIQELNCINGVCNCNDQGYWNGSACESKRTFGSTCKSDKQCSSIAMLFCASYKKQCVCPSER